jgi:hypothetical protein
MRKQGGGDGGTTEKRPEMNAAKAFRALVAIFVLAAASVPLVAEAATPGKPVAPRVTTGGTSAVRGTSATLLGSVDTGNSPASYYFQYGPTVAYIKQTAPGKLPAGTTRVKVGQAVSGLIAGYHYRLVATNAVHPTPVYGKDRVFGVKKKSLKTKFTLPKSSPPTNYGGTYVLSGTLSGPGNANRALALQASPYPFLEAFTTVGLAAHTDAAGRFSFRVSHLTKTTQFRVATLDPRPVYSPVTTQLVGVKVTLKVRSSGHRGLVRLYGTVTPAKPGAHLDFQLFKAVRPGNSPKAEERTARFATQFSTLVKKGTATVSRFSAIVKVVRAGAYRAYVSLPRRAAVSSGWSPSVLLHAAPGSSKQH